MFTLINKDDSGYKVGREALISCWKWLEGEKISVDDLYNYIDSEDYIDVAEFANKENDKQKQEAWYSLLDAVSYTIYQAYLKENRKFVPQAVEVVDDETLIIQVKNAFESNNFKKESVSDVIKYLMENYSVNDSIKTLNHIKRDNLLLS